MPVFNSEKYLVNCLNSVINQSLKNIEIICINDGSNDNSSKILELYSKYDDRFVILNQNNKGSGLSRNRGIKISKGKYISFLDSDDMYYDNMALELLYNKAMKNKAIICGGGMEKVREIKNRTVVNHTLFDSEGFKNYRDYQYDYDYQRFIYNTNFLKRNKLYFPKYLRYQDPPFFIKTMFKAKKFYTIKNITNIYRKNIDKELNLNQVIDMFYALKECLELGEKLNLYQLYNITLNRLNIKLFIKSAKKFSKEKKLRIIISKIIKNINYEILDKYHFNFTLDKFYANIISES
jgi:glycosyltransferase involved in cell wall biosynthesis